MNTARVLTVTLLCLVVFGCGKKKKAEPAAETAPVAATETATDAAPQIRPRNVTPEEALAAAKACWNRAEGCRPEGASLTLVDQVPTDAASGALFEDLLAAFPNLTMEPQLVLVNGNSVAAVLLIEGKAKGTLWGANVAGKQLAVYAGHVLQVGGEEVEGAIDAKVVRDELYLDQAVVLAQLGVRPAKNAPRRVEKFSDPLEVLATPDDAQKANFVTFNKGYVEARNKGDLAKLAEAYASNAMLISGSEAGQYTDAASIKVRNAKRVSGVETMMRRQWGAGDWIVFESLVSTPSAKETEAPVQSKRLELLRFADGKIVQVWEFSNELNQAAALGQFDAASLKVERAAAPQ